jgi:hypothetical protein
MPARHKPKDRAFHSDICRARIQASNLINRLQDFALQKNPRHRPLTVAQIRAIEVLLRKCVPDLVQADVSAEVTHRYVVEIPPLLSQNQWSEKYSLAPPAIKSLPIVEENEDSSPAVVDQEAHDPLSMPSFDLKGLRHQ